ncbi:crinkler (CRN) family protein [Thraustotheca clavata]|uniref:Crinkler (CRN) family protein n=1 Tax=Thraustotheca clavata TaxID=74557 RepID=A0A1V9Y9Z7_9STRA|nr:crinkler (CRN) family protein [Thraustotheca clavata]
MEGLNCWYFVDGLTQSGLKEYKIYTMFNILATSGQYKMKNDGRMHTCLVPFWTESDLRKYGLTYLGMTEDEINARYHVSGGSLREFVTEENIAVIHMIDALNEIGKPEDAEILLSTNGISSNKQIDRIRMKGVKNVNDCTHYMLRNEWTASYNLV